jgi:hypothetical protein
MKCIETFLIFIFLINFFVNDVIVIHFILGSPFQFFKNLLHGFFDQSHV